MLILLVGLVLIAVMLGIFEVLNKRFQEALGISKMQYVIEWEEGPEPR